MAGVKKTREKKENEIIGNYVALVTPFYKDKVDERSLRNLIDFVIEKGCHGVVPCGTTGESATLTPEEHVKVIELTLKHVGGRVKVMAGTGSNSTREAIELTKEAKKLGVDSVLLIAPYYNKPTQKGLYEHFRKIAESVDIPQVLYNIPGRTAVNISADTMIKLSKNCKNIVGVKEASGNLFQISKIVRETSRSFSVLSGDDALTLPILSVGGKGVISASANVVPDKLTALVVSFLEGKTSEALSMHQRLLDIFEVLFIETNPVPVKTALYLMGVIRSPEVRLPLAPMKKENEQKLKKVLKKKKILK